MHELMQQRVAGTLGFHVIAGGIGIAQLAADRHLMFFTEVVDHVADFMHLTALDQSARAGGWQQ